MLQSGNRIGEFDRTIIFQQKVIGSNDFNEDEITDWENIGADAEVPAKIVEKQGSERFEADKLTEYRSTTFTIRYRQDISTKNRIINDDGLIYDILSINETARRRYQDILAQTKGEYYS